MILAIARREFAMLFRSPLPWLLLGIAQLIAGWWFLSLVDRYETVYKPEVEAASLPMGVTELIFMPYFGSEVVLGTVVVMAAVLAMRMIAEERRSGRIRLLDSAPVRVSEWVLGKYLAMVGVLLVLVAALMVLPLSLFMGAEPDAWRLAAAALALVLFAMAVAAAGLFASALTVQPPVALALTLGFVLGLRGIDLVADQQDPLTAYLALLPHYEALVQGEVGTVSVVYFLLIAIGFTGLTIQRMDGRRLRGD